MGNDRDLRGALTSASRVGPDKSSGYRMRAIAAWKGAGALATVSCAATARGGFAARSSWRDPRTGLAASVRHLWPTGTGNVSLLHSNVCFVILQ
jgi:hypothetical protein